jgi:MFS family permease
MPDFLPLWLIGVVFILLSLAAYEIGFRTGRWWQRRTPGEQEGPTGVLVGSLLALLAFMLAIATGMAADRFEARRGFVIEQANDIRVAYLQAAYLPAPANDQVQELLREYAPLQIRPSDVEAFEQNDARASALEGQLWSITQEVARTNSNDVIAEFVVSLSDVTTVRETRLNAVVNVRVPTTVLWLLIAGAVLSLGMVGFGAGVTEHRSMITAVVLIVALGATILLVLDLDNPFQGLISVSQQPLVDVVNFLGPP